MLDNYFVREGSLENVVRDGKTVGFRFAVQACNYRGCYLSLVRGYYVKCDGVEYPLEAQRFQINGKEPRTYDEIKRTAIWEHWNFGDEAYIYVDKEGGLAPGEHELVVQECILSQYGYAKWDEEWVTNPPTPGQGAVGKVAKPSTFIMQVQ